MKYLFVPHSHSQLPPLHTMNNTREVITSGDGHESDNGPGDGHKTAVQGSSDLFNCERGEVDFRGVSWLGAAILIAKFQIGLGALSLPATFDVLGFFPDILCFIVLAIIKTIAGYVCGNARQYYPYMHSNQRRS